MADMKLDVLAFGAHPDDVEISMGGTLIKLQKAGYKTGLIDFTKGEAGTYGTVEERGKEADAAARVLGLSARENLGFPDGQVRNTEEARLAAVNMIRKYRPEIVFAPVTRTRHPDHGAVGEIVHEARFIAGLEKLKTDKDKFRPSAVIRYPDLYKGTPDFAVDVSDVWDQKIESIKAHASQVYDEKLEAEQVKTLIKSKEFWEVVEAKCRYYGGVIGAKYAEVFYCESIPVVTDLVQSFTRNIK